MSFENITSLIMKSRKISRPDNTPIIKCILSSVTLPLQESCRSINSLLYGIGGVILFQMFLHKAISRNN